MNTPKTTSLEENVDNDFIGTSFQTLRTTVLVSLIVAISTIIILWWTKYRQHRLRRGGECLLLCGISNAGKTLLFNRLTSGAEKRNFNSKTINHGTMMLDYLSSDRPIKKVPVINITGNLRLCQRDFNTYKTSAKAIIFVIDSSTIEKEIKHVTDYLYNMLHEKYFRDHRLPLLIFCNKQDLTNNEQNLQSIRHLLEHELTMKRKISTSSITSSQKKNETQDDIGRLEKETFEFNDVKDIHIEFAEGSAFSARKKSFDKQYKDEEINNHMSNLLRVHQWIAKIWFQ